MNQKENNFPPPGRFIWRVIACQVVSYFVMGLLALTLLNYEKEFTSGPLAGGGISAWRRRWE